MGVMPTDLIIKSCIEYAFKDLRRNTWILDDIFGDLATDPLLREEYGYKEITTAKEWFLNAEIPVLLQHRIADDPPIPCISIAYMPSSEMQERTNLADAQIVEDFDPETAGIMKIRVVDQFTPKNYDRATGEMTLPKTIDMCVIVVGQFVVSKKSGKQYEIIGCSDQGVTIAAGIDDDFSGACIIPKDAIWNMHKELTYLNERYSIGVHAQSSPAQTIWLWQIVFYSLLRYKEAYLDERCFELSSLSSSALERDQNFAGENVFSKYIEIGGQVQTSWIKFVAPRLDGTTASIATGTMRTPDRFRVPDDGWLMTEDLEDPEEIIPTEDCD
jgi:hypothetical protein